MDMIERVARVMFATDWPKDNWERFKQGDAATNRYLAMARAAIEAMKQATGPMAQQGAEAVNPYTDEMREYADNVEVALDVWNAMIQAALEEK